MSAVIEDVHPRAILSNGLSDEGTIRGFTQEDVRRFQHNWLRPDNAIIVVVSGVEREEIVALMEGALKRWRAPATARPQKSTPPVGLPAAPRILLIDRPGAEQSVILGGIAIPGADAPNALAITTMSKVLGDGFSSRINMNLRESKQWSYGAGTQIVEGRGQSLLYVSAPVQTDKTAPALAELVRELTDLNGSKPILQSEMTAVVRGSMRELPALPESVNAVSYWLRSSVAFGRPLDYPRQLVARYRALTLADLQAAAREVIRPESLIWVVVGDRAKIEAPLAALNIAPLERWTADGRPLE